MSRKGAKSRKVYSAWSLLSTLNSQLSSLNVPRSSEPQNFRTIRPLSTLNPQRSTFIVYLSTFTSEPQNLRTIRPLSTLNVNRSTFIVHRSPFLPLFSLFPLVSSLFIIKCLPLRHHLLQVHEQFFICQRRIVCVSP